MIHDVRTQWQFYRDRRPELYGSIGKVGVGHGSGKQ